MKNYTYIQILNDLEEANHWLEQIGIRSNNHRIEFATSKVKELESAWIDENKKRELIKDSGIGSLLWALVESYEFIQIYNAFKDFDNIKSIKDKLKDALAGPFEPISEDSDTNQGRNIMFELNLSRVIHECGLKVSLEVNPDIYFEFEEYKILIQCKRPFSSKGIKKNIVRAKKQLIRDFDVLNEKTSRGIIAVSISRIVNKGDGIILVKDRSSVYSALMEIMEDVVKNCREHYIKLDDDRIIGILFHYISPASIEDEKYPFVAEFTQLHSIASNKPDTNLMKNLAEIFDNYSNL